MDKIIEKQEQKRRSRKRLFRGMAMASPVVIVVGVVIWLASGTGVRKSELIISEAHRGALEATVAASGRVVPAFEEIVSSPIDSRILAVYAQPGDSVSEGMPLLELDLRSTETQYKNLRDVHQIKVNELRQLRLANRSALTDLDMQVRIKEMEVNTLGIDVQNEQRLDSIGSGTGERVRKAITAYQTGKLQLEALRQKLVAERERLAAIEDAAALEVGNSARDLGEMEHIVRQGRIPAPHNGILTYLSNSIGSNVGAGEKVAVIGDLSRFKVTAEVPEGSSYRVRPGANVKVRLNNVELDGSVANVEPQSTGGAVPFTVTLTDASNARLRPGIRAQVYVAYGFKESAVLIPNGEYFTGPGEYKIFIDEGSKLVRRNVVLGESNRQWVEVVEGIEPGEKVVSSDMSKYLSHKTLSVR
ncbi:MAG: HlyD family efflux transporter periplasmic adaptor subunit [Muribaculaceae bacterium]|nr:HlyD family efflux transporter periplasmic adaptor subunit [Muribaculaceae bacterium]